jgi:molybdopterin-binding protein
MRLSARNQLNATIDSVHLGEVMVIIKSTEVMIGKPD